MKLFKIILNVIASLLLTVLTLTLISESWIEQLSDARRDILIYAIMSVYALIILGVYLYIKKRYN